MKSAETDSSLSAAAAVAPWEGVRAESVHPQYPPSLGAIPLSTGQTLFRVWAPKLSAVQLELTGPEGPADHPRTVELQAEPRGYFSTVVDEAGPGSLYRFRTGEGTSFPDPASRLQPHGVHEASAVVATGFNWTDSGWAGIPLRDYIIYELHIGTFTPQGTFESAIAALDGLVELGITAVELMPVAQCPGGRNWGYDGVYPYAAQNTWGGPEGLKRFVDACHSRGLAVVLDVVYNHLGPEGNYLQQFGHYFTHRYSTPWGAALNFDDSYSDEVRRYFIENALYWIRDCHIDALRLDAVHAIYDQSACPFLRELGDAVRLQGELCGRRACSIAESNLNDPAMILPAERGGNGLDGQWVDDLHHALHVVLTGEREGYYADFHGFDDLVTAWERGFIYSGQYSEFRHRRHGEAADGLPLESFVVCSQNHDQIGNRMLGERLTTLADFEQLKLAAGTVLLSPYVPLLFMGEEYAEPAPFPFFISHTDADLVQAVRNGRREEFASFSWQGEPPDPQSEDTFGQAKLDHDLKQDGRHAAMYGLYRELISLRKTHPAMRVADRRQLEVASCAEQRILSCLRKSARGSLLVLLHFGEEDLQTKWPVPAGQWQVLFNSAATRWHGPRNISTPGSDNTLVESAGEVAFDLAPWSFIVLSSPISLY